MPPPTRLFVLSARSGCERIAKIVKGKCLNVLMIEISVKRKGFEMTKMMTSCERLGFKLKYALAQLIVIVEMNCMKPFG